MASYLIGDIQGCYQPLLMLLEVIKFNPANDRLWCCGDLVNRGGDSLKVLRLLHGLSDSCSVTLGNHDLYLLNEHRKHPRGGSKSAEMDEILRAHDCASLIEWLNDQPLAAWSPEHRILRVHAGVIPQWDVDQVLALAGEVEQVLHSRKRGKFLKKMYGNRPDSWDESLHGIKRLRFISNVLTRLRFCDEQGKLALKLNGAPGSQPKPYKPWYKHKQRKTRNVTVAFGHWAALGLRIKKRTLALDTGCVWGGKLSAVRVEDRALFQVPCVKR